jgi:response regulator RpfG family c-di-GMP phosphodiesterase
MFRKGQLFKAFPNRFLGNFRHDSYPVAVLADDDPAESSILRSVLEQCKFVVVQAADGISAFDSVLKFSAQLVVAALQLPAMNGYQLCQKLRQLSITESIPLILITPQGEFPDRLMGHETFASDYVQRPVNLNEFEQRLSAVLSMRQQHDEGVDREGFSKQSENLLLELRNLLKSRKPANPNAGQSVDEIFAQFNIRPRHLTESGDDSKPKADALPRKYADQLEISEKAALVYKQATDFLSVSFRRAEANRPVDVQSGSEITRHVVGSLQKENGLLRLATEPSSEFSLRQHSVNVAIMASSIAQNRGMSEDLMIRTCLAGMLHDIGTVKLPKRLIYKTEVLSPSERAEIRRRPIYSAEILSASQGFEWLPQIVCQVYERENGTGYPYQLEGKQIVDEARVLGISDALEACIHPRPYRNSHRNRPR